MYKELNVDELYEVFHKTAMQLSFHRVNYV
jgi:hypothetical protein